MIVKQVAAGAKTAGLLAYLYGPGVGEARGGTVHVNPRTVASWDGQSSVHFPKQLASGRRSVGGLARSLDAPVALVTKAPAKHVGHIVVANHPDDPVLSDAQWRQIAADVMRRAGLSKGPQDPDAVRWIAVRHDDTSIHIAYTKVRESGRAAGYVNYTRAWEAMRHEWEERLGLVPTGKADGTARRPYGQAESARTKAQQAAGAVDARPDTAELRHLCRVSALEVRDVEAYFARLRSAGVTVAQEHGPDGEVSGYRVGLRSRADGEPVLYSGSQLDPTLKLETLTARWRGTERSLPGNGTSTIASVPSEPSAPCLDADSIDDVLRRAAEVTARRSFFDAAESYCAADLRARSVEGAGSLQRTGGAATARRLRSIASLLGAFARLDPAAGQQSQAAELALAIASLLAERAAWHDSQMDRVGAAAALRAQRAVATLAHALSSATPVSLPTRGAEPAVHLSPSEEIGPETSVRR